MTSRDFCCWLQGYLEVSIAGQAEALFLNTAQTECVRKHLALVFVHEIDPSMGPPAHQAKLSQIHSPPVSEGLGPKMRC